MKKHVIVLFAFLAACSPAQQHQAQRQTNDAVILAEARARIAAVDPATLSEVHIAAADGRLTLTGEVRSETERRKIDDAARATNGVKVVDDRLAINPRARTANEIADDIALETKVEAALASQTGVNALHLKAHAERGVVTISGTVRTRALHDTAIDAVKSVSGIKRVIDRITIQR